MSDMSRYMIRDKAQKPRRVTLIDPATGKPTEDWIDVRSSLSDEFIEARDRAMGELSEFEPNEEKRKAATKERQLRMKASLVAGWSFDQPATEQNIMEFLSEAPQIQQMLLNVADDSASFFSAPSEGSSGGRKRK